MGLNLFFVVTLLILFSQLQASTVPNVTEPLLTNRFTGKWKLGSIARHRLLKSENGIFTLISQPYSFEGLSYNLEGRSSIFDGSFLMTEILPYDFHGLYNETTKEITGLMIPEIYVLKRNGRRHFNDTQYEKLLIELDKTPKVSSFYKLCYFNVNFKVEINSTDSDSNLSNSDIMMTGSIDSPNCNIKINIEQLVPYKEPKIRNQEIFYVFLIVLSTAAQINGVIKQMKFTNTQAFLPKKYDYSHPINDRDPESDNTCVICMFEIDIENQEYMITPCNHLFHKNCLTHWLDIKLECPTCRTVIPPP
ncbi:dsc e3 ubiquitin ligase complex subunit 1 [Anaeramoeba flamelloides]|uniref:Dsc e3 ubiquitin ligase complex subunit n=1 Tax=Anaeramoeba flamelloides TaxID=1746091 RepID=A0AAV7YE08_9EUKA|nr:dsc e3 ubiquitin ligase complex subunit [Anaeramoeba flamelloides]KAJ6228116.1 dsc e3 ubiquitin ligase complex subunit 1 [Anaeramoeba flamelloides]